MPEVPVDWLKAEWRRRGLLKNVQLSISGCLGPCDVPNVVKIDLREETIWLGKIERFDQYREILDWATWSRAAGRLLPLPKDLGGAHARSVSMRNAARRGIRFRNHDPSRFVLTGGGSFEGIGRGASVLRGERPVLRCP
jgi:hypothetical protein